MADGGSWSGIPGPTDEIGVPVEDAVAEEIARLDPASQRLFWATLLREILSHPVNGRRVHSIYPRVDAELAKAYDDFQHKRLKTVVALVAVKARELLDLHRRGELQDYARNVGRLRGGRNGDAR